MKCEIPDAGLDDSFDSLRESFESQNYWVRFFMRPCCPPPGESTARNLVEHLKSDIDSRQDFTKEQKDQLKRMAADRLEWYLRLPVRHTA